MADTGVNVANGMLLPLSVLYMSASGEFDQVGIYNVPSAAIYDVYKPSFSN